MANGNKHKAAAVAAKAKPATAVESPERSGPGRPPGSPNIDYERCVTIPVKCRKCGSTEFGRRQHIVSRMHNGSVDGHEYNCISHYKCRCANEKCRQATVIIEYRTVPVASEEAGYDKPDESGTDEADLDDALDLDDILAEEAGT